MIVTVSTYQSTLLPRSPIRHNLAQAEADEARGAEMMAYLAMLPGLKNHPASSDSDKTSYLSREACWDVALKTGLDASSRSAWDSAWALARSGPRDVALSAIAIVVRDFISVEQFDLITAPMRLVGVDFDKLGLKK